MTSGASVQDVSCADQAHSLRTRRLRTNWILVTKSKQQSEGFVEVERIVVENFDVKIPLFQVIC